MKANAEKLDKTRVQLTVEIPEDEFEKSMQKAYLKVVKKLNIPGFRKGKAPRRILENIYGREILLEEALKDAVPKSYIEALEQHQDEFTAVSEPDYEMVQTEKGAPVVFKAAFDIKPEVILGQYTGLELEKTIKEITTEDIDKELEQMQQRYAKLAEVEGPAQLKDVLNIDFEGKIDEEPFPGGTGQDYSLELGSNTFIPGFEEQLVGVNKDDTIDVKVTFPDDYHSQDLAGKAAVFTVKVKEIKRKELTKLDDEFAKDVSEFATMQELREDIENRLKEAAEKKSENELREAAVKKVIDNAQVEIPFSMIEGRIHTMMDDFALRLQQQGISFDYYLQATNSKYEDMKEAYKKPAEISVKTDLVLEALAKEEKIQVTPEDLDEEIKNMAELYKQDAAKVRDIMEKQGRISSLEFGIMIDKAVDFIIEKAEISNKTE